MVKNFFLKHLSLAVTLAGAAALSLESYLSLGQRSLCPTQACQTVGRYLIFDGSLLVAAGAIFFWLLTIVLFFAGRYPDRFKNAPFYFLALALAIDSSLVGFQFFTIQQKCLLCISVALLLAVISLLYCFSKKSFVILVCFALLWIGGFTVQKIMIITPPTGAFANMTFFTSKIIRDIPGSANKHTDMTLIMSVNCSHCLEVISFLAQHYPLDANIKLAAIDSDTRSLAKLSLFLQQAPVAENPFRLLKEIKESASATPATITDALKTQTKNGSIFLSNIGIKNIPVLMVNISENEKKILIGTSEIIPYLTSLLAAPTAPDPAMK
ncbi:MAG: hypothetical protein NT087_03165 [Deltaproteobacteria bacterium]|nr:hypothetical protein [Deltaproteobacteria bacterium]